MKRETRTHIKASSSTGPRKTQKVTAKRPAKAVGPKQKPASPRKASGRPSRGLKEEGAARGQLAHVGLDRAAIINAAIEILDTEGLEALSMRRLASALGVVPNALYHHVPNKSAIYDAIQEAVMAKVDLSEMNKLLDPFERIVEAMKRFRLAMLVHARAMPIISARAIRTEGALKPLEALLELLEPFDIVPRERLSIVNAICRCAVGMVNSEVHHLLDTEYHDDRNTPFWNDIDLKRYPQIAKLVAIIDEHCSFEYEYELGIRGLVVGLLEQKLRPDQ